MITGVDLSGQRCSGSRVPIVADDADRVWVGSMPDAYEHQLAPTVFRPFAIDLARRVSARSPGRVLELAAGTGVLTRELVAAVASADVIATDFNAAMVDFGREHVPQATWLQADALNLPFDPGSFDLTACQFGVTFFPDKQSAFTEARRVLTAAGTLLFNTWASLDSHDFQAAVDDALRRVFPDDPPTFLASVPHGYADPEVIVSDLRTAGFQHVTVETVTFEGIAQSAADIAAGYCTGTPLRAAIETRADLHTTIAVITKELQARLGTGAVTGRMSAYVIEATANVPRAQ
jgi:ubiquinone/menaquinone biosynthesis C-methylase UbiE